MENKIQELITELVDKLILAELERRYPSEHKIDFGGKQKERKADKPRSPAPAANAAKDEERKRKAREYQRAWYAKKHGKPSPGGGAPKKNALRGERLTPEQKAKLDRIKNGITADDIK